MNDTDFAQGLLDLLLSPPATPLAARAWGADEWTRVRLAARQHRLGPLLHWRLTREHPSVDVPAEAAQQFAASFRRATLRTLRLQAELSATLGRLRAAGIECLALKGVYLAAHVYPHPALRPMRDLDLLVRPHEAGRAWALLADAGYAACDPAFPEAAAATPETRRHETPLRSPGTGVLIEIHGRLHDANELGRPEASIDVAEDVWGRRHRCLVGDLGVDVPAATDLLLHLVVHACYHHRFDNGPLCFVDIALLLATHEIDWPMLRAGCAAGGWTRGAQLLLGLLDGRLGTDHARQLGAAPDPALESLGRIATTLSVQDMTGRPQQLLSTSMDRFPGPGGRLGALGRKTFPPRALLGELTHRDPRSWRIGLSYLERWGHLARRAVALGRTFADRDLQRRVRADRRAAGVLVDWLQLPATGGGQPRRPEGVQ